MAQVFKHADGKVRWGVVATSIVTFLSITGMVAGWEFGKDAYAAVRDAPALRAEVDVLKANHLVLKGTLAETNSRLSQVQVQLDIVIPLLREHHQ